MYIKTFHTSKYFLNGLICVHTVDGSDTHCPCCHVPQQRTA